MTTPVVIGSERSEIGLPAAMELLSSGALDAFGELCVGVSTSGYPWKYPGGPPDPLAAELRALALTLDGRHGGAAGQEGSTYAVMTPDHEAPEVLARLGPSAGRPA